MNLDYCYKICQKGKKSGKEFLENSDSVFEAASDFRAFTENCFKTCPYKNEHTKEKSE
jgi:hypothetical protein